MAQIAVTSKKDFEQKIAEQSWFGVADPCCGSGAMAIALAKVLEQTYKVQDLDIKLLIELTDIDYTCVKMAFVNMSLLGLSARVILGDTITGRQDMVLETPCLQITCLQGRFRAKEYKESEQSQKQRAGLKCEQLTLF
jgi:hypothetical protein